MGLISRVSSRTYRFSRFYFCVYKNMFRQGFRHARRFAAAGMNNNQHYQPNFQAKLPQFRLESTSLAISSPHSSIMQIVQNSGLASLLEAIEGEDDDDTIHGRKKRWLF